MRQPGAFDESRQKGLDRAAASVEWVEASIPGQLQIPLFSGST